MTELVLYNAPQSTNSQRARFALHLKGLSFHERKLNLFSGDQLNPEYLALNPEGVVPTLVHDGTPVTESAVILEYLEDVYPDTAPLRAGGPLELASLRARLRFIDEVLSRSIRIPSFNLAYLPFYRSMSEKEFQAHCDSRPSRRDFLMRMGRTGFTESDVVAATECLRRGVARHAAWISESGGPWVMGKELSLVDVAIMPVFVRMEDIDLGHLWSEFPQVATWLATLRETDAFRKTFYFGSLMSENYPHVANLREQRLAEAMT